MTDDEIIAVVKAHKEGKKIQGRVKNTSVFYTPCLEPYEWMDWPHLSTKEPCWDFGNIDYRVAPEPRKPREWWLGFDNHAYNYEYEAARTGKVTHVREVLE